MKKIVYILFLQIIAYCGFAQQTIQSDFQFGNGFYFNMNVGETVVFSDVEIKLLKLENHFNQFKIGKDTLWFKVSRRTLPNIISGLRIFVADNKNVSALTDNNQVHGLLKKDVLLCISEFAKPLLDPNKFVFPVSFNDGFLWNTEEDSHMFSYKMKADENGKIQNYAHEGISIDLHDARGIEKHLLVAIENSSVVWIEDKDLSEPDKEASVLLKSELQPGIYYLYEHLYNKNVFVKKGDKLVRGEAIGGIWGDDNWGQLQMSVVKSDTVPNYQTRYSNLVNFFPQLFELYFNTSYTISRHYTKGSIKFGQRSEFNGDEKNIAALEHYSGKGWVFGKWNRTDKVEYISKGNEGNVRLRKILFSGESASCENPNNWFDYEINVKNGVYRIRANVGDLEQESWQKIAFEGVTANTYKLKGGEFKWTDERIVKVEDGRLTVKIYIDETNQLVSGLSEIVFQQAY